MARLLRNHCCVRFLRHVSRRDNWTMKTANGRAGHADFGDRLIKECVMKKTFLLAGVLTLSGLMATSAYAGTISLGLQEAGYNGGAISTVASGGLNNGAIFGGSYGSFAVN